ncbi:MAG: tRNA-2-methylthio-N6-dimethylallyladenosine synthase [Candidatus Atribacteria bacterium]|nr:tRNA-2-methylthio-N6-dimethylallyladenosine synthase [Candidatus Atribacteria bacterium]
MKKGLTFAIKTFGCQMNKSRSEHLVHLLENEGFSLGDKDSAQILIFNTCAVREHAVEKAVSIISCLSRRNSSPYPLIVVCGCMSQLYREKLLKRVPAVDILVGTHNLENLPELITRRLEEQEKVVSFWEEAPFEFREEGYRRTTEISTFLPISYGCDNFCSYCVVPYTTGRLRSKPQGLILKELEKIIEEGFKEVILLGQNVNAYGKDLASPSSCSFINLLDTIEDRWGREKIWIGFLTSHPKDMTRGIVERVRESRVLKPYFHFPLQAGSNRVLKRMNRKYTQKQYLEMAAFIREAIPEAGIGTDLIVGFPGEEERDFEETLKVVEEVKFEVAYTYLYSPRPGTAAAQLADDVPLSSKKERLQKLNSLLRQLHRQRVQNLVATKTTILIDKKEANWVSGRTKSNLRVYLRDSSKKLGSFAEVIISHTEGNKLWGELI